MTSSFLLKRLTDELTNEMLLEFDIWKMGECRQWGKRMRECVRGLHVYILWNLVLCLSDIKPRWIWFCIQYIHHQVYGIFAKHRTMSDLVLYMIHTTSNLCRICQTWNHVGVCPVSGIYDIKIVLGLTLRHNFFTYRLIYNCLFNHHVHYFITHNDVLACT